MKTGSLCFAWLSVLLLSLASCSRAPRASGPLPHEAYAWQRAWTNPVAESIQQSAKNLAGFVPLVAEVDWKESEPLVTRIAINYDALKRANRPVGLAMRIGNFSGPFRADDNVARGLKKLAVSLIGEAAAHGIFVKELQIDFDCAASKLDGYRTWLGAIRDAVKPVPVCITALPSWLDQPGFRTLAKEAGSFVLQVHSVEPPRDNREMRLCDPALAEKWVESAAKVGLPFRVALPTYTYLVAFDADGKITGISAEGALAAWPQSVRLHYLRADALELFALVQRWTSDRPANLTGVIWYRLPVANDTMNWRWPTLAAIIAGHTPQSALRVEATDAQPADIALVNDGEIDEPLPAAVLAEWSGAHLVSADALNGFVLENETAAVRFRATPEAAAQARLSPGERRAIGWVRLDPGAKVHVSIPKN